MFAALKGLRVKKGSKLCRGGGRRQPCITAPAWQTKDPIEVLHLMDPIPKGFIVMNDLKNGG